MPTILLGIPPDEVTAAQLAEIRALAPGHRVLVSRDHAEMEAALDDIEIVFDGFPRDLLARAPKLRWYQQGSAGVDWLLRHPELAAKDFILTNGSGIHAVPISEQIMAYCFALARELPSAVHAQRERRWARGEFNHVFELAGQTMLLIGVGAIGGRTAEIAKGIGMRVLGVRRNPEVAHPAVEAMYAPGRLLEALPLADWVVITAPYTPETKGMIGERELRAMKPTAYIVNIGRGATIQQAALVRALQEGWIRGAGLDVTDPEPLPADSPLWDMPNVIITPHTSGRTPRRPERAMALFLDNLGRYLRGEPMRNVVDKKLGY